MSKFSTLSQCLVDKFAINQADADSFVREFFDTIKEYIETDKLVKVKGLGTFKLVDTSARETIDINTRERITIEGKQKISFTPENAVRDRINSPFVQFESIEIDDEIDLSAIEMLENPAPVKTTVVVEQKEQVEEQKEPVVKPEPIKEESHIKERSPINEEIAPLEEVEQASTKSHVPYYVMGLIAIIVVALVGYFSYQMGKNNAVSALQPINEQDEVEVVEEQSDVSLPLEQSVSQNDAPIVDAQKEDYNSDPRIKTGAYDIVGLETTVKVKPNQTLKSISKDFLGPDMECYVEAFNGGIKEVNVGDEVKIPKVKVKESAKKKFRR